MGVDGSCRSIIVMCGVGLCKVSRLSFVCSRVLMKNCQLQNRRCVSYPYYMTLLPPRPPTTYKSTTTTTMLKLVYSGRGNPFDSSVHTSLSTT